MKPSPCHHYLLARVLLAIGATSAVSAASSGGNAVSADESDSSQNAPTKTRCTTSAV